MKIAIIGCGSIGTRHLENLITLGERDLLLCEPNGIRAENLRQKYGFKTYSDLAAILQESPDICLITSPTIYHETTLTAILEGSHAHLFVEKPVSHQALNWKAVSALAADGRRKIMVGCNMRFHPCLKLVKSELESGVLGRVISARIEAGQYLPDWHPEEDYRALYSAKQSLGGGCLLDYIHEIDYAGWMFGPAMSVLCRTGRFSGLEIDTEDCAELLIEFTHCPLASLHVDYVQRAYARSCKVIGEKGTLLWGIDERKVRRYLCAEMRWEEFPEPASFTFNDLYVEEMKYFLACVREGRSPMSSLDEGFSAVQIVEAAKSSSRQGVKVFIQGAQ